MDHFVTVDNLKHCEAKLRKRLAAEGRTVGGAGAGDGLVKRAIYTSMQSVRQTLAGADVSLRELNNATLNAARKAILDHVVATGDRADAGGAVHRDVAVFGSARPLVYNVHTAKPAAPEADAADVAAAYEKAMGERQREARELSMPPAAAAAATAAIVSAPSDEEQGPSWNDVSRPAVIVEAMAGDEFASRMKRMEQERSEQMADNAALLPPPPGTADAGAIMKLALQDQDDFRDRTLAVSADAADNLMPGGGPAMALPASRTVRSTLERCIAVNGSDRDWAAHPHRYKYTVSMGGGSHVSALGGAALQNTFRNIRWLQATSLVLPMEIMPLAASDPRSGAKPFYQYEYSFAYPYVVLQLDGLDGVYDGTNDALRRAFCVFVYRRSYKAPNGRGYIILHPAQEERKEFLGSPLSSLRSMSLSVVKPNGTLLNNSVDTNTVTRVEYDPTHRLYLRLVTSQYFDRNEFYPGDIVRMQGFEAESAPGAADQGTVYASLNTFMCRPEGHELVLAGQPNDQGFHRSFYILAPGVLDQGAGRLVIDAHLIGAVQAMDPSADGGPKGSLRTPGRLLNTSLQAVMTLRMGVEGGGLTPVGDH